MPRWIPLDRSTTELLQRAAATRLNSARIVMRSTQIIVQSIFVAQMVARTSQRISTVQIEALRTKAQRKRAAQQGENRRIANEATMPLTPPRLLELAEEFRGLAASAATPESKAAFENLVFRYTALAAGFDSERVGSQRLH